jgi:hypothetical protein
LKASEAWSIAMRTMTIPRIQSSAATRRTGGL